MSPKTSRAAPRRDTPGTAKGRRGFLKQGAALVTGAASAGLAQGANAQGLAGQPWERVYGAPFTGYGQPSRFEQPVMRYLGKPYGDLAPGSGSALAPIESLEGIITPSGLHNNRSHSGTPDIDPKQHQLLLHGLVARPLVFSMDALWGYPMTSRIHFLECSGNMNVKWLRRLKATEEPTHTKDETSKYTDLQPDGRALQFTFEMGVKSVITRPSSTMKLPRTGFYEISGIAWSGAGRIRRVEVSTDGGATWADAALTGEERPKSLVRFRLPWEWTGGEAVLQSRATDEKGQVQPARKAWLAQYSVNPYHNNSIVSWSVGADGGVKNVYV